MLYGFQPGMSSAVAHGPLAIRPSLSSGPGARSRSVVVAQALAGLTGEPHPLAVDPMMWQRYQPEPSQESAYVDSTQHGQEFAEYAGRTKKYVPFVY